jgi:hypothetical protein
LIGLEIPQNRSASSSFAYTFNFVGINVNPVKLCGDHFRMSTFFTALHEGGHQKGIDDSPEQALGGV